MNRDDRIKHYRQRIAEAQTEQAHLQAQIANAHLEMGDAQILAWRNRFAHLERMEREYRARLERALRDG